MKPALPRRSISWLVVACCLAGAAAPAAPAEEQARARQARAPADVQTEARVIVKFKAESALMRAMSANTAAADAGPQHAKVMSTRLGLVLTDGRTMGPRSQLMRASGLSSKALAEKLSAQPDVEYAVVDGRMHALAGAPNDPLFLNNAQAQTPAAGQWYLQVPGSISPFASGLPLIAAINAEAGWAITAGNRAIVVADLDTGVRYDHPDLTAKLLPGYDFITDPFTANDGTGRDSDASDPGDAVTQADVGKSGCTSADIGNSSWHGTQTAGLIGASTDNGIGMASIGHDVMVLPLRVLGKCGGVDSDIIDAMNWAAGIAVAGVPANPTPARVLNLSLGSPSGTACSPAYQDAINAVLAKNVVVVAAAGNDGLAIGSPANCAGVVAVAGVRHAGTKSGLSDLGSEVTVSAPFGNCVNSNGTCVFPMLSTSNSGTTTPVTGAAGATYTSGGADYAIGTSFSTPLVSGTVALMLSANATLTPNQVAAALKASARPFPSTCAETGDPSCTSAVTTCVDPATLNGAAQAECFCTSTTCGAGLLDAGAAVASVAKLQANISGAPVSVVAGTAVVLDATRSNGTSAADLLSYQWTITTGADIATLSAPNAATTTLSSTAAGTVTVSLTVSGSLDAAPVTTSATFAVTPAATSTGSSSGGGAFDPRWLLALAVAVALLWVEGRRRR